MNSVEADGSTIDEAIDNALKTLNVGRDRVEIEILTPATKGIFGIGGKKARVRATLRPPLDLAVHPAPEKGIAERAKTVLRDILCLIGVDANIDAEQSEEKGGVCLTVSGDAGGLLIGRRGETLDALEFLLNRMVSRDEESGKIFLDTENYRERRRKSLEDLALRLGEKAKRQRRAVTLNPLSPRDRRIIHLTLQDDPLVVTKSMGKGYYRRLLIIPEGTEGEARKASKARSS